MGRPNRAGFVKLPAVSRVTGLSVYDRSGGRVALH